jgi:hypothetical protein
LFGKEGVAMALRVGRCVFRLCAAACAIVACASAAAAQPKLESSSLGHWRGYWMSDVNPTLQGPVQQFIDSERNRRVHGSMEWIDRSGQLLRLDLAGTTSASCNFNYELKGAEGVRLLIHGMHDPGFAMGHYMLFNPGLVDEGNIFLVQEFNGAAPNVLGHFMGTATSDVGIAHDFALYIQKQDRDPETEGTLGNFEGFAEAPSPFGELRFDFDGRIDGKGHASVVGLGPAGIFFVDAQFESGEGGKMFSGEYMIIFADGTTEQGGLELSMPRIIIGDTNVSPGH